VKRFWGGDRHVHHVTRVTILGVSLRPMSEAKVIVVVDLVGEAHHPGILSKFFLMVEVEPRVPCVRVLGLVLILVGEEFNGSAFFNEVVFDPISRAFVMPLCGSFDVGGEVVY